MPQKYKPRQLRGGSQSEIEGRLIDVKAVLEIGPETEVLANEVGTLAGKFCCRMVSP